MFGNAGTHVRLCAQNPPNHCGPAYKEEKMNVPYFRR